MKAIITYHSLDNSGSPISLNPDVFARHVEWLASGRVRVVPLRELQGDSSGDDVVALTFDDAFANFASVAVPLLMRHRLTATVFVVSGRVGLTNAWGGTDERGIPTLPLMDWDAIGDVARDGFSVGGHTRSHARLVHASDAQLVDEIAGCADDIARNIGEHPRAFAYPYGDTSAGAARCVREHFEVACTTELRTVAQSDDTVLLPRLDAYYFRKPGVLESWGSSAFDRLIRRRALARRVRSRLRDGFRSEGSLLWTR